MINNKIDLTSILAGKNFTQNRIADSNAYRNQSFCFSLTEFFTSRGITNKRTNLFIFTLNDDYVEGILNLLAENEIGANISFTGIKDKYMTYEVNLNKKVENDEWELM